VSIRLRSGTVADVETFAGLINAQHQWLRGEDLWDKQELASLLVSPTSDPVRYDRYLEVDGLVVAGLHTHVSEPFSRASVYLACPPGARRIEYAKQLIDASERVLRSRSEIPRDATIQIDVPQEDTELSRLLISTGFLHKDDVVILESDVAGSAAAVWPEGFSQKTLEVATDLERAFELMRVSFVPEPGGWHVARDDFLYMMRNDPTAQGGLTVLAMHDNDPVGIAVNFVDTTRAETGLVGMLGVTPHLRRQGIGKALLLESLSRFRAQGWGHARLATITGHSKGNLRFFQSVGLEPIFVNQVYVKAIH
jgi:GNAT superfamily N-acetyltransferase